MTSPIDLCTINQVKAYSPDVQGNNLDGLLGELVTSESRFISKWCERELVTQDVDIVESINGEDIDMLPLRNWPIRSISSVVVDGETWVYAPTGSTMGYRFSKRFLFAIGRWFPRGRMNVVVTYRGGYLKNEVPEDLQQACAELVAYRLAERKRLGQQSKTLNGEQVTYTDGPMPKSISARLQDYKTYIMSGSL